MKSRGESTPPYIPPARYLFPLPLVIGLPYRGLLGSVVRQLADSSAKLDGEEFFVVGTAKIIELPGRSGLVLRLEGRCRRQAVVGNLSHYIFSLDRSRCRVEGRW
jgi:hypothetical protein